MTFYLCEDIHSQLMHPGKKIPKTWFYVSDRDPHSRFSPYAFAKPTATAFEIALELHLDQIERRHGHCVNEFLWTCAECRRGAPSKTAPPAKEEYRSLLDEAPEVTAEKAVSRHRRRGLDRYTKAAYHVLAVHVMTAPHRVHR